MMAALINRVNVWFSAKFPNSETESNNMKNEARIEVDCGLTCLRNRSLRAKRILEKKNSNGRKFKKFVRQQTNEEIYEDMGSIFVLILIIFLIFVHFMAEWEMSLDLDYTQLNTCTQSANKK